MTLFLLDASIKTLIMKIKISSKYMNMVSVKLLKDTKTHPLPLARQKTYSRRSIQKMLYTTQIYTNFTLYHF